MFGILETSLKHFFKVYKEEYRRARRLHVLVRLLSGLSTILTFASLFVTIQIRVGAWLPLLLWSALAMCLLILLLVGFIANFKYHIRIVGNLEGDSAANLQAVFSKHERELSELESEHKRQVENLNIRITDLESELRKLTEHKITFKIDERETTVFLLEPPDKPLVLIANIEISFKNVDVNDWSIETLDLTLHKLREGGSDEVTTLTGTPQFIAPSIEYGHPEGLMLKGGEITPFYMYDVRLSISDPDINTSSDLTSLHFLRVTMLTATHSPPFTGMLLPNWTDALKKDGGGVLTIGADAIHGWDRRIK
jgi:hypothetical protein